MCLKTNILVSKHVSEENIFFTKSKVWCLVITILFSEAVFVSIRIICRFVYIRTFGVLVYL
jgi:hypothetical protein